MRITVSEDTTFLITDDLGNVPEGAELGLYHDDTRFLCQYELTVDGLPPLVLTAKATDSYTATHFLTNPALADVPRGALGIVRSRLVGEGMHEDIDITNHGDGVATFALELRFDADFAHIFEVKRDIEVKKDAARCGGTFRQEIARDGHSLRFIYDGGELQRQLAINFTEAPQVEDGRCWYELSLQPRERWHLCIDFLTLCGEDREEPAFTCEREQSPAVRERRERRYTEWIQASPLLHTDSPVLQRAYEQSVRDFSALRIRGEDVSQGEFTIAAGIPWFMALFGRDSLIASFQALPFFPEMAKGVLRTLARRQGTRVDRLRGEEPGKILHEHRQGILTGAQRIIPAFPYYGTIDATPLFLILLAAVYRATGDLGLARELREHASRAVEWMGEYGDRDGDGYLEYLLETDVGLHNQGWKDSFDSVRFRDGTIARPPIALCEVQGYAYAARSGMAEVFDGLGERERAARLRQDAASLREQFNRDFWLPDQGYFAEALDGDKRPVDSVTSNPGQLLWTGIVDEDKARLVAERLLSPELFSGWGIRTMATTEGGYNPISYHNGSVWPHDNSLIVAGLARYGFVEEAAKVTEGLLAALAQYPDHRLPELFAGYGREEVPFPVEYPTASRPQAWASGSVFLLLTTMLGLPVAAADPVLGVKAFAPSDIRNLRIEDLWVDQHPATAELTRPRATSEAFVTFR